MKINHLTLCLMAVAATAMTGCSNDEPSSSTPVFQGDTAYLNVEIAYANGSRATAGGFDTTTANENMVNTLAFYFYDDAGNYITKASKTTSWTTNQDIIGSTNVSNLGTATVVLEGLKDKSYPKYMIVVANSDDKYEGMSIESCQKHLVENAWEITNGTIDNFVMSSVTYKANSNETNGTDENGHWFAVKVAESNFLEQYPTESSVNNSNSVKCYIERLAAKVKVGNPASAAPSNVTVTIDNTEITGNPYKITTSLTGVTDGNVSTATEQELYIVISNWGLNATANKSYLGKVIDIDWNFDNFTWNDADNHRSYWAESWLYDQKSGWTSEVQDANGNNTVNNATQLVNHLTWNQLDKAIGGHDYCLENTNSLSGLKNNGDSYLSSRATSVLVKAIVCQKDGENKYTPITLYNYENTLMTQEAFLTILLNNKKYWASLSEGSITTWRTLDYNDIEFKDNGNGKVSVDYTDAAKKLTWYSKSGGTYADMVTLPDLSGKTASVFKDGMSYYCIPIEHLNTGYNYVFGKSEWKEADYGVVRNHYYQITINSVSKLGTAVFDPEELIIPNDDDTKLYKIGAQVNVLSWKIVNQGVDL